ncbi:cellulose binding domain-containing protein [Spirillospora sp. CA-253888]
MPPPPRHSKRGRRRRPPRPLRLSAWTRWLTSRRPAPHRPVPGLPYFLTAALLLVLGPAAVLTLLPVPGSTLRATYSKINDWGTGYTAQYTVTNTGDLPEQDWALSFRLPPGARMTNLLNGRYNVSGGRVTVRDRDWNDELPSGRSVAVIFTVDTRRGDGDPTGCMINNAVCTPLHAPELARSPIRFRPGGADMAITP